MNLKRGKTLSCEKTSPIVYTTFIPRAYSLLHCRRCAIRELLYKIVTVFVIFTPFGSSSHCVTGSEFNSLLFLTMQVIMSRELIVILKFTDAAIRYLVDKVLSARIDNGIRDSIRLRRESSLNREKLICCK